MKSIGINDELKNRMLDYINNCFGEDIFINEKSINDKTIDLKSNKQIVETLFEKMNFYDEIDELIIGFQSMKTVHLSEDCNYLIFDDDAEYHSFIRVMNDYEGGKPLVSSIETYPIIKKNIKIVNSLLIFAKAIFNIFLITISIPIGISIIIGVYKVSGDWAYAYGVLMILSFIIVLFKNFKLLNWIIVCLACPILGLIVLLFLPSANNENVDAELNEENRKSANNVGTFLSFVSIGILVMFILYLRNI